MGRARSAIGARHRMPNPTVQGPWDSARRRRVLPGLRRLTRNANTAEPVFHADEMDVHLNPNRPRLGAQGPPALCRHARPAEQDALGASALNATTEKVTWMDAPTKASDPFCKPIWKLAAEYRDARRICLIVDNYIIEELMVHVVAFMAAYDQKKKLTFTQARGRCIRIAIARHVRIRGTGVPSRRRRRSHLPACPTASGAPRKVRLRPGFAWGLGSRSSAVLV